MEFRVLVVCTGNICRSPVAERMLRARLNPDWPVSVTSAGTYGVVGRGIDGPSATALREYGIDPGEHVARRISRDLIATADLILTAESTHRSSVVQAEPMAFRRSFTLREFGRLGAGLAPFTAVPPTGNDLRARVIEVADQRGVVDPPEYGGDDIGDPYGADLSVARACVAQISQTIDDVVRALGGVVSNAPAAGA